MAYLSNHKTELEEKMDDDELRQKREIIQLENEKVNWFKIFHLTFVFQWKMAANYFLYNSYNFNIFFWYVNQITCSYYLICSE